MKDVSFHLKTIARKTTIVTCTGLFLIIPAGPSEGERSSLTFGDNTEYAAGAYLAYLAPWNKGSLRAGKDYEDTLTVEPSNFPDATVIRWRWPRTPPRAVGGVYNFLAIDFGNYNDTTTKEPVMPAKIVYIKKLIQVHDVAPAGAVSSFDVITDMFLTAKAGNSKTQVTEVEVFLHTPAYAFGSMLRGRRIGTFSGSGLTWTVALIAGPVPDIVFVPDGNDIGRATLDLKAMLDYLTATGIVNGQEFFNGLALGAEVRKGSGSLVINHFRVDYAR